MTTNFFSRATAPPPDLAWIDKVTPAYLKERMKECKGTPGKMNAEEMKAWLRNHCNAHKDDRQPPERAYRPAKKQKKSKDPNGKSTKPTPKTEPLRRCWIYMIIDRRRHVVIYVGQSVDCDRRWQQHERGAIAKDSKTGLADYLEREQTTTDMLELRLVDGLPNGVAWKDADSWEAFFISKHRTVYDPQNNKRVCNKNNGNDATRIDFDAQKAELERGYVWPEAPQPAQGAAGASAPPPPVLSTATAIVKVPTKLDSALGLEACLRDAQAMLGQANAPLRWHGSGADGKQGQVTLSTITADCDRLERGAYAHGLALRAKYSPENMAQDKEVRRDEVVADVASFGEWAEEGDELYEEIKRQKVGLAPDKFVQFASRGADGVAVPTVTAEYANGAMHMMLARAGQFEEAGLRAGTDTRLSPTDVEMATAVREWMRAHGGAKPNMNAAARTGRYVVTDAAAFNTERMLGRWLMKLKSGGGARIAGARAILRHQSEVLAYFESDLNQDARAKAQAVNALLRRGFGTLKEVAEGLARQPWIKKLTGRDDSVKLLEVYKSFLKGAYNGLLDVVLEVGGELTIEGAARRRALHKENVEEQKALKAAWTTSNVERWRAGTAERQRQDAVVINGFLRKGHAHASEMRASSAVKLTRLTAAVLGDTPHARRQQILLGQFMNGHCFHIAEVLLKDLDASRVATIRSLEEAARAKRPAATSPSACTSSPSASSSTSTMPVPVDVPAPVVSEKAKRKQPASLSEVAPAVKVRVCDTMDAFLRKGKEAAAVATTAGRNKGCTGRRDAMVESDSD